MQQCKHHFIIQQVELPYANAKGAVLRFCEHCGVTSRLALHLDNTYHWKPVIEEGGSDDVAVDETKDQET